MVGHYEYGQQPPAATVHSELHGFSMRMLMDANFGAVHFNMFVISFPDCGLCNHHDHPFEEAYVILGCEVAVTFDRSADSRVGKECVCPCRSRCSPVL